ncbi:MAG: minichromosome maintenance protein MCM [Candidatus Thermoplasmatota archaeon]|nr:minichromosome maintenance protein MCM [Candidatus Thermoplasmatota archaeon]
MREYFRDDEVRSFWNKLLESKTEDISRINSIDSKDKTLSFSYEAMDRVDMNFALLFLRYPEEYLNLLKDVLYGRGDGGTKHEGLLSEDFRSRKDARIRISISSKLPDIKRDIRELRSEDMNTFLQVEGVVKRVSEVVPTVVNAAYQCSYCREISLYPQVGNRILEPVKCDHCGRPKDEVKFKFIAERSTYYDTQIITIEEKPEFLKGAAQPARLVVHLEDELCGKNNPGDRVAINGILKGKQKPQYNQNLSRQFDIYLEAMYVERESSEYEEVMLEDEDVKAIKRASKDPEVYNKLVGSIAPAVFGNEIVKEAVILQLFGGERKAFEDGTYIRGDIHVLLFGDPGVAKSQILTYAANIAPKSVYTSGKGSSAAGLTAAAVKDELSEGRWTLEAGTLVLADGGLAAVDELDKMDKEDSGAMHQAMEQQTVSISKAGINATLMSRCAVLAAANPKFGRYDESEPFSAQTEFPVTLLSRFDLIFVIVDRPGKVDSDMADYILKVHKAGESIASGRGGEKAQVYPVFEHDFLKKYIVYARKTSFPMMSSKASDMIKKFYVDKRASTSKQGTISITPRQLEAMVRLSEASARVRLSERVDEQDVDRAQKLMD